MKEKITNNNWSLVINLDGARIEELKFGDELILGTFERMDGKTGNTHICAPNFGDEGMKKFDLNFHGPFRKMEWKILSKNDNSLEIEAVSLDLKVKQIFKINDYFEQRVIIENLGNKDRLVNVAIHNYLDARNGWRGSKLNGKVIDNLILGNTSEEIEKENVLEIPGKRLIRVEVSGFKYGQFWTAFRENDNKKEFNENYFCFEPCLEKQGFLDSGVENNLGVGEQVEVSQRIKIEV